MSTTSEDYIGDVDDVGGVADILTSLKIWKKSNNWERFWSKMQKMVPRKELHVLVGRGVEDESSSAPFSGATCETQYGKEWFLMNRTN
ncbi:hypothetical protein EVAR_54973_1 [Eumeta japonica]|uniref:Uncharacterized protein n=1 Tax=Eumeta variegata TaxID=151549 RepID=A0A4C1YJC2_EUMVA|nr:hypothetical protein EVAR_54973_1 [Eumeta japonica]